MIENKESGIYNFVNKNKINMYDLYLWTKQKYEKTDKYIKLYKKYNNNKKCCTQKNLIETKRESVELFPDKLEHNNCIEIYDSLNKL